jgi:molecular chaperone GrpE
MKDHKKRSAEAAQTETEPTPPPPAAPPIPVASAAAAAAAVQTGGAALVEPPENAVVRLEEELAALQDKYLRLAAEYDNFRKRTIRERTESWGKAQAELLSRLVDAFDDLARFAHIDPVQTDAKTIHDGVDLVERKIWKELDAVGVTRIDQVGVSFDPHLHEAVTMGPADDPAKDHTVGAVLQAGYKLGGVLLRPARVVVLTWQGGVEAQG